MKFFFSPKAGEVIIRELPPYAKVVGMAIKNVRPYDVQLNAEDIRRLLAGPHEEMRDYLHHLMYLVQP